MVVSITCLVCVVFDGNDNEMRTLCVGLVFVLVFDFIDFFWQMRLQETTP